MRKLNLDSSKQYDTDISSDGGLTWKAGPSGSCSGAVEASVAGADEHGHAVHVDGQVVITGDGYSLLRWTPRS
ncbi:hypothetical protein EF919_18180 [Streptomyces sp. WAC02707]|uniref:hypothetical protein n=1 Tax=Streptomyces TaxID=1883 RepID=UPI000F77BB91|nr:hypothetical protein [Streptomyces sp. WAC02707]RSS92462.1 hypothetical protein EF919_18180 [Streptomyces sp. WAC02707]